MKRLLSVYASGIAAALLFQLAGYQLRLHLDSPTPVVPGLDLELSQNHGFAWGVDAPLVLVIVIGLFALFLLNVLYLHSAKKTGVADAAFALLFAGAFSNIAERVFLGSVTDYVKLTFMPIPNFNLADISLTLGALLLIVFSKRVFK